MKRLILFISTLLLLLVSPAAAFASSNPLTAACTAQGGAGSSSSTCSSKSASGKNLIFGTGGVIEKATLILATIGGIAAVFIIIISGIRIVTSNGDSNSMAGARNAIIGALVGLILIGVATSIVTFVVSKIG